MPSCFNAPVPMPEVVGLFHDPWKHEPAGRLPGRWFRALRFKANPRDEAYMRALFAERWPQGRFLTVDPGADLTGSLSSAQAAVKLYPDAIGLRLGWLDAAVSQAVSGTAAVWVLNGRRRYFAFSRGTQLRLQLRRLLEATMLPELACLLPFLAVTAAWVLWDGLRKHQ